MWDRTIDKVKDVAIVTLVLALAAFVGGAGSCLVRLAWQGWDAPPVAAQQTVHGRPCR